MWGQGGGGWAQGSATAPGEEQPMSMGHCSKAWHFRQQHTPFTYCSAPSAVDGAQMGTLPRHQAYPPQNKTNKTKLTLFSCNHIKQEVGRPPVQPGQAAWCPLHSSCEHLQGKRCHGLSAPLHDLGFTSFQGKISLVEACSLTSKPREGGQVGSEHLCAGGTLTQFGSKLGRGFNMLQTLNVALVQGKQVIPTPAGIIF